VLTNPLLVFYYLQGQVVKDIKVEKGKGGAKGKVKRRKGGGRERVIKVNKAR
jgi:hypothetical protein